MAWFWRLNTVNVRDGVGPAHFFHLAGWSLPGQLIIACPTDFYLFLQNAEVYACLFELLLLFSKIA